MPSSVVAFSQAPNRFKSVRGVDLTYRDFGNKNGSTLVLLHHWGATLDNHDPLIVDGLGERHRIVAVDYRGVGLSTGVAPTTIAEMGEDVIAFVEAMQLTRFHLLGFSLGGFVAQEVVARVPPSISVTHLVLAGTGAAGGEGVGNWGGVDNAVPFGFLKAILTFRDPKYYLFFPPNDVGRNAADAFLARLQERKSDRDGKPSLRVMYNQALAIHQWGQRPKQDLSKITIPVLICNGDNDIMVPTSSSHDMATRFPNAKLIIYPNAGHGAVFQEHSDFVAQTLDFLRSAPASKM